MKKILFAAIFVAATAATTSSLAFGLPAGLPGVGGGSGSGAAQADLSGQQDALVRNFVGAGQQVLNAQARLAGALNLKTESAKAEETARQMSGGATQGGVKDSEKVVADTNGAIAAALARKPVLDANAKAQYAEGLARLVDSGIKYAGLGKDVTSMGTGLKGASPLALAKLSDAAFIVSKFPGSASELVKTVKAAIEFAKDQGIPVPANSGDLMKAI
jgi:hypothetical protein